MGRENDMKPIIFALPVSSIV